MLRWNSGLGGAHGSPKTRDDLSGLCLVQRVALAERASQHPLLCCGTPHERCYETCNQNQEGRPAAECERLTQCEHGKAEIDGVAYKAIGTGRDKPRGLLCNGHEAPSRT